MQTCLKGEHFKALMFKDVFLPVNVCRGERCRADRRQTDKEHSMQERRKMDRFIAYGFATVAELFTHSYTASLVVHSGLYFQTEKDINLRCLGKEKKKVK